MPSKSLSLFWNVIKLHEFVPLFPLNLSRENMCKFQHENILKRPVAMIITSTVRCLDNCCSNLSELLLCSKLVNIFCVTSKTIPQCVQTTESNWMWWTITEILIDGNDVLRNSETNLISHSYKEPTFHWIFSSFADIIRMWNASKCI